MHCQLEGVAGCGSSFLPGANIIPVLPGCWEIGVVDFDIKDTVHMSWSTHHPKMCMHFVVINSFISGGEKKKKKALPQRIMFFTVSFKCYGA